MRPNRMTIWIGLVLACSAALLTAEEPAPAKEPAGGATMLPVKGLHCFAPSKADSAFCEKFIREVLPKEGVNTLVLGGSSHGSRQRHCWPQMNTDKHGWGSSN